MNVKIRVLHVRANQRPEVVEVDQGLPEMQRLVGGYIECLALGNGIDLWLNEEGALEELPINFLIPGIAPTPAQDDFVIYASPDLARPGERGVHVIHGDVFFARSDEDGETASLTDEDIAKLTACFSAR